MPGVLAPRITRENAREFQRRSAESRLRARRAADEQAELLRKAVEVVSLNPLLLNDYRAIRLARVRKALDTSDAKLQAAIDHGDSEDATRWAKTVDLLAEQERLLAGRPAPKAEESRRNHVRQGQRNSEAAAQDRAEPTPQK